MTGCFLLLIKGNETARYIVNTNNKKLPDARRFIPLNLHPKACHPERSVSEVKDLLVIIAQKLIKPCSRCTSQAPWPGIYSLADR
jgi:hypothetical protein